MLPLQISVIGAGYWGKKVIREILSLAERTGKVSLCSVVDNSPSILQQCTKEFGPLKCHLNYRDLLSDPNVEAVHICSPNPFHFELASEFLRSKKDVLVEKPLTLRTMEAYELVRLAKTTGGVLSTGHLHRFNNGVRELKRVVESGVLGDVYYLRLRWTGLLPPQKERDVITDLGPHPFDICNHVLGLWPTKVSCTGRGYRGRTSEEVAFITAEYMNGMIASIELSWLDHEKRREVAVVGSDAVARLDCLDQKLVLQSPDGTEPVSVVQSNTLGEEILHFAECIEHKARSEAYINLTDGALGAGVVRLLAASKRSLYEERTVQAQRPESLEISASEQIHQGFRKLTD